MTSISPAPIQIPANNITSQTDRAGSPSVAGSNPPAALPPQQVRSYANATKSNTTVTSGGQHARTVSVNNRNQSMAAPTAANAALPNGGSDHSRKPSVTISTAQGYGPNGGPLSAGSRAPINFGQFNNDGNPSAGNSAPEQSSNSLMASQHNPNPRITTPAKSPSPIPQPAASGGRVPSGFQTQNGPPNFGAMNGPENGIPQGPGMSNQPIHLRRQSSQQSDASNASMQYSQGGGPNRQYMNNQSRQRSFHAGGYNQQMPYSPGPGQPRSVSNQPRQAYPHAFQNQGSYMQSPAPPRSPGFHPPGSQPGTPHMGHQQMYGGYQQQQAPPYGAYSQHPGQHNEAYGMQPAYSNQYNYYQQQQGYQMHPQYMGGQQGPPSSPSPFRQAPPSAGQQYQQRQFNQSSQQMSRTPSHASTIDRPSSSLGGPQQQPQPSQTPSNSARSHTPSQSKSEFSIPKRESKAIVIKDANGNVISMKKESSAATASSGIKSPPTPAVPEPVTATKTDTPSPAATPAPAHARSESKTGKTAEEIRAQFLANVKSTQSTAEKIEEDKSIAEVDNEKEGELQQTGTTKDADDKAAKEKADAEAKAAELKREQDEADAAAEKQRAEAKAATEREEQAKAQAESAKAEQEKADAAAKQAEQDKAEEQKATEATAADENKTADAEPAGDAPQGMSDEDAEIERQIAEMEAAEKAEEEREKAYAEKKKAAAEEKAARDKAAASDPDAEMKRQEREAEEAEERRERERAQKEAKEAGEDDGEGEDVEDHDDKDSAFESLKKPTIGPGADSAAESGTATPASDDSMAAPSKSGAPSKIKPSPLKLDTAKVVEPPQQTPGMKSLKSARMLQIQSEPIQYPEGIQSPNPALIKGGKRGGKVYDPAFLMQFADVFKEKPSIDWDQKLKESIGDTNEPSSARSARTPMTGKAPSQRGGPPPPAYQGMGNFGAGGGRTLPTGTTSADRFAASQQGGRTMTNPMAGFAAGRPGFQMGQMAPPNRAPSAGNMLNQARANTSARGSSRRGPNANELAKQNKSMPLTASGEVKGLEMSKSGWKATSVGSAGPGFAGPDLSGHMAPDMVQRKVKLNLNKMTPERFDKISDQILQIAAQSKDESDGRTLRQVIALTFEKACDEAHWAEMYAKFCLAMLDRMSPDIKDENIRGKDGAPVSGGGLFRKYLLTRCQEEFEQGWEANLPDKPEGENEEAAMLSDEYYVAAAAKRKGLGLIQFIGELFKLRMLSVKIMHQCFMRLIDFEGTPDETTIESLVRLIRTVGPTLDAGDQGPMMNAYFERIEKVMKKEDLPSRMHFMLLDIVDLRRKGWESKDKNKGPTTITEIREQAQIQQAQDAARQAQSRQQNRMPSNRGGPNDFGRSMPPPDNSSRMVTDDLRRLGNRASQQSRQASGPRTLGPSSMFSSRSASGRAPIGPGGALGRNASAAGSPAGSNKGNDAPAAGGGNAFAALAGMGDAEAESRTPVASPKPATATPATEGGSSS